MSAKPVQVRDFVFLLGGAANAVIARPCDVHFSIIRVTVPLKMEQPITTLVHDFRLIWDWKMDAPAVQENYGSKLKTVIPENIGGVRGRLSKAIRFENAPGILEKAEEYKRAEEKLQEAVTGYMIAFVLEHENRDMISITEEVAIAAAGNKHYGTEIMSLLLNRMGDKIHVSERVAIAAAGNARCGKEIMSLLLNEKRE